MGMNVNTFTMIRLIEPAWRLNDENYPNFDCRNTCPDDR